MMPPFRNEELRCAFFDLARTGWGYYNQHIKIEEGVFMIYDTLENRHIYDRVHPGVARGLEFLAQTDLKSLPDGRVEIDGDKIGRAHV